MDSYRKISRGGKAIRRYVLCKSPWCHQPAGRLEELQDQASIAQCEENECHFKIGFSAGLLVQKEAVEQMKEMGTTG